MPRKLEVSKRILLFLNRSLETRSKEVYNNRVFADVAPMVEQFTRNE